MIVVRIELWPFGDRRRARLLQEVAISNIGVRSDGVTGEYDVVVSHSSTFRGDGTLAGGDGHPARPDPQRVWKRGRCTHRRSDSPTHLVRRALTAALGGRR